MPDCIRLAMAVALHCHCEERSDFVILSLRARTPPAFWRGNLFFILFILVF